MSSGSRRADKGGGVATDLSAGLVARVARGIRYVVSGVGPDDWFGPSQPLLPIAQEQAEGRVLDYRVGYNLSLKPRDEEAIGFHQLRALADNCFQVRLTVETRKDQMQRLSWNIQPRLLPGMKPSDLKAARTSDARIKALETFFAKPDGRTNWSTWLRQLVEEMLVTDAASLYKRRNLGGQLFGLQQIDGATIKRVIDENGMTPMPPSPAYQQILHGLPAVDYTSDQLMYLPRNPRIHKLYGFSPVEQVVMIVNIALRRQVAQLNYFTEGNIPEALVTVPLDWKPVQIREMQEFFDGMLSGNLAKRAGARFIPGGMDVKFTKDALLKDEFDEWLARIVCYAFSVPPTPFIKQMNRATADNAHDAALQEGLAPVQEWVKALIDEVIAVDFNAPDLEFAWNDDRVMDPQVAMTVNTGYVAAGLKTRNEVRSELGLDGIAGGDEITITTASGVTKLADALDPPEPPPPQFQPAPADHQAEGEPPADPNPGKKKDLTEKRSPHQVKPINRNRAAVKTARKAIGGTVKAFFAEQKPKAIAAILKNYKPGDAAKREVDFDIDWDALFDPVNDALRDLLQDSGGEALAQVGVTDKGITELVNQDAVDYAAKRAAEMVGKRVDDDGKLVDNPDASMAISDTTRDMLRDTVAKAETEGWSTDKLSKQLSTSYAFSQSRAQTIARTETAMADVGGNMIAYRRSGVVTGKRWILGSNHDVEDECNDNANAGVIALDDTFPTGDDAPPQHPNCVCDVIPVTGDLEE